MQIRKDQVDYMEQRKWIPSCQFAAKSKGDRLTDIEHHILLIGAKAPHDYLNIDIPCYAGKCIA